MKSELSRQLRPRRWLAWLVVWMCSWVNGPVNAQGQAPALTEIQRDQREQIEQWRRQAQRPADLPQDTGDTTWLPPLDDESPCVVLRSVRIGLAPSATSRQDPPVPEPLQQPPIDFLGRCLGASSLQRLQGNLQKRLQALGYITSTLETPEQNLGSGELQLLLRWGYVGQILIVSDDGSAAQAGPHLPSSHSLALQTGQVLNLRDIEHTLENLGRLPSQAARFLIEPGAETQHSHLRIVLGSPSPLWRGNIGLDSSQIGHRHPWDAQAQLWWDAPLHRSDQLMLSASATPQQSDPQQTRRHSLYAAWSLPWGRHLLTLSASSARHSRSIAGGVGRFSEHGDEQQAGLRWQWTGWRGPDWRTQLWMGWNERRSRSHIDDVELLSRRRVASELSLGLAHWQRLACGDFGVELEGGQTRRLARVADFQDLAAPKPRQWRAQLDWRCAGWPGAPQVLARWQWTLSAWTQAVERPFDGTDLPTLGSRYSVRGHTASQSLQGRRISVARMGVAAPWLQPLQGFALQPAIGGDFGHLDRPLSDDLAAHRQPRSLQAVALTLRAQAGPATAELSWARPTGHTLTAKQGHWQLQAVWWF